jgi:hypothetical protein
MPIGRSPTPFPLKPYFRSQTAIPGVSLHKNQQIMEPYSKNTGSQIPEKKEPREKRDWGNGRLWTGLVIILVGGIWLAREAGADIPHWLTGGPIWLVALGLFIGARCNFKNWFWLIPILIGVAQIIDREFWRYNIKPFIWPAVLVAVGLFIIFRPRRKKGENQFDWREHVGKGTDMSSSEDVIDSVSVFGSTKKNILSKDFRGGEVVNFFGGTELNLAQADITKPIVLEMVQVFGGAKLIVPSSWTIHSTELVSVFGGVDDKRMMQGNVDPTKVLILKGTNVFGGLEIKSY